MGTTQGSRMTDRETDAERERERRRYNNYWDSQTSSFSLNFHHTDPKTKSIGTSNKNLYHLFFNSSLYILGYILCRQYICAWHRRAHRSSTRFIRVCARFSSLDFFPLFFFEENKITKWNVNTGIRS